MTDRPDRDLAKNGRGGKRKPRDAPAAGIALSPSVGAVEAFQTICRDIQRQFAEAQEGVTSSNPDALHQMRVALRRLDAAIKLFSGLLTRKQTEHILTELKWIGRRLSFARDLDVFTAEIVLPLKVKYPADTEIKSLYRKCLGCQKAEYRRVRAVMVSKRFRIFSLDVARAVDRLNATGSGSDRPARVVVADSLTRMKRKIERAERLKELNRHDLHRLRLRIKAMRYALEFIPGLVVGDRQSKRFDRMLASLRCMQSALGEIGDIAARPEIFEKITGRSGPANRSIRRRIVGLKLKNERRRRKRLKQSGQARDDLSRTGPFWVWDTE